MDPDLSIIQDDAVDGEADEPNKHLVDSLHKVSSYETELLLSSDDEGSKPMVYLPKDLVCSNTESPRTALAKFIPEIPLKFNNVSSNQQCDCSDYVHRTRSETLGGFTNQSFHISLSLEDEIDSKEHTFSKSYDCSEEVIQSLEEYNRPISRSYSADVLRMPDSMHRRISVMTTKGKLMGVQRVKPGQKHLRSQSVGGQSVSKPQRKISDASIEDKPVKEKFTRRQIVICFCLCLVDFTSFLSMSIIAPFFPREAASKGMRESVSGFVFSIYALVMMLASPVFGKLLPKMGAKCMFLSGVLLCGVCNILFGLLDRVYDETAFAVLCFVVRTFEAVGAAAFCTASCTILMDQFPDHIGTVFGFTETCIGVGMSIGPAIGGALYSIGGFGLPFFTLGAFVIAIVPLCWYLMRSVHDPTAILNTSVSYKKLLSMPHVIVVCLILAVASQAQGFIDPTLEPHMRQYNLDTGIIGLLFLLLSGSYAISSPIVGWISGKVENKYPIMVIGLLLVSGSMLLLGPSGFLPIQGSLWLSIVALILMGLSFAAAYVPTFESMFIAAMNGGLEDDINTYSVVSGLWNSVYSLGEVTGPSLGGILSEFFTFPESSTLIAICTLAAFLVAMIAWINPCMCFGPYSLVEDAEEKQESADETSNVTPDLSREQTPLQDGSIHSYGAVWEDKKNPVV